MAKITIFALFLCRNVGLYSFGGLKQRYYYEKFIVLFQQCCFTVNIVFIQQKSFLFHCDY